MFQNIPRKIYEHFGVKKSNACFLKFSESG